MGVFVEGQKKKAGVGEAQGETRKGTRGAKAGSTGRGGYVPCVLSLRGEREVKHVYDSRGRGEVKSGEDADCSTLKVGKNVITPQNRVGINNPGLEGH